MSDRISCQCLHAKKKKNAVRTSARDLGKAVHAIFITSSTCNYDSLAVSVSHTRKLTLSFVDRVREISVRVRVHCVKPIWTAVRSAVPLNGHLSALPLVSVRTRSSADGQTDTTYNFCVIVSYVHSLRQNSTAGPIFFFSVCLGNVVAATTSARRCLTACPFSCYEAVLAFLFVLHPCLCYSLAPRRLHSPKTMNSLSPLSQFTAHNTAADLFHQVYHSCVL